MNINLISFANTISPSLSLPIHSFITRKVILAAIVIFGSLALLAYGLFKFKVSGDGAPFIGDEKKISNLSLSDSPKNPDSPKNLSLPDSPKYDPISAPFIWDEKKFPNLSLPDSPKYDPIRGKENTEKFMNAQKNILEIVEVARASVIHKYARHYCNSEDSIFLQDIFEYGDEKQIVAIMQNLSSDRVFLRKFMGIALNRIENDPNDQKWKNCLVNTVEALTQQQIENYFAVDVTRSSHWKKNELNEMNLENILKLNAPKLPSKMIEAAQSILPYYKYIIQKTKKNLSD